MLSKSTDCDDFGIRLETRLETGLETELETRLVKFERTICASKPFASSEERNSTMADLKEWQKNLVL